MKSYYLIFLMTSLATNLSCQASTDMYIGPEKGALVIVGGSLKSTDIIDRFIELAGGLDANFVVIPTASGRDTYDQNAGLAPRLRNQGATNVTVLHTNDRLEANSDVFVESLRQADAVWFGGGRQWRLVDSYKDTKAEELFHEVLNRGGVIGGSSAGATIQGSYLARGDTKNNQVMMGDHEEGFGFLKNVAIDQHVLARNRHFDLFSILDNRPELLGLGIDENTAIVVEGNQFEVMGDSHVLVYDGSFYSKEGYELKVLPEKSRMFYFLSNGDRYDLKKRKVIAN